ncbi:MAG: hypothetical protein WCI23_06860 [Chlorobiaceae bacterium]
MFSVSALVVKCAMLAGTAGLVGSEGCSPLSRDGALLYSRAPGGVVLGLSWFRSKAVLRFRSCYGGL